MEIYEILAVIEQWKDGLICTAEKDYVLYGHKHVERYCDNMPCRVGCPNPILSTTKDN